MVGCLQIRIRDISNALTLCMYVGHALIYAPVKTADPQEGYIYCWSLGRNRYDMIYRKNPPIRPGLIHEGSVGEGRLQGSYTRVWSYWWNIVLLKSLQVWDFYHSAPCRISCQSTLMQAIHRLGISTRVLFMIWSYLWVPTYHRQLCQIAIFWGLETRVWSIYVWVWSYWRIFTVVSK